MLLLSGPHSKCTQACFMCVFKAGDACIGSKGCIFDAFWLQEHTIVHYIRADSMHACVYLWQTMHLMMAKTSNSRTNAFACTACT